MFDPARDRYVKSEAERRRFSVSYLLNRKGRNMEKAKKGKNWRFETIQVHTGQEEADESMGARAVPIYQTTSYVFRNSQHAEDLFSLSEPGNIYGRLTNPTQEILEKRIAALEGGAAALAVSSGAAAITYAIENIACSGDHIAVSKNIYGGTYNLFAHTLKERGITVTFVDPDEEGAFEDAIRENTKAVFAEVMGNPNSSLLDIEKTAEAAHAHGIPLIIDSTFTPPNLIRPIEHGADIVVHSLTKFIGGHGTALGGIIIDSGMFDWEKSGRFNVLTEPSESYHGLSFVNASGNLAYITRLRAVGLRDMGACISPFNAFLILQGVETLSLRVERQVENAMKVIEYLKNSPAVEKVNHPSLPECGYKELYDKYFPNGAGSIFTFEIKGGEREAKEFIDRLELFSLLANVADVKSLAIHPASTTHAQLNPQELEEQGIKENTIRLSIGTENIEDIIEDIDSALGAQQC